MEKGSRCNPHSSTRWIRREVSPALALPSKMTICALERLGVCSTTAAQGELTIGINLSMLSARKRLDAFVSVRVCRIL